MLASLLSLEGTGPLRDVSQFTIAVSLMGMNSVGLQSQMFGGLPFRCCSWKLGCLIWGKNSSLLRKELQVLRSLSIVSCHIGGRVYGQDCVSTFPTCFGVISLSFVWCEEVTLPVFSLVSHSPPTPPHQEEIVLYVALDSVCLWEEMSLGFSVLTFWTRTLFS